MNYKYTDAIVIVSPLYSWMWWTTKHLPMTQTSPTSTAWLLSSVSICIEVTNKQIWTFAYKQVAGGYWAHWGSTTWNNPILSHLIYHVCLIYLAIYLVRLKTVLYKRSAKKKTKLWIWQFNYQPGQNVFLGEKLLISLKELAQLL